ncbi:MAG: DUF924 domain-containing protein [Gammaproteobacteria bacterium]|nr:DUF924 domain-containing protein [Gammaproteobacteria bacterium]
MNHQSAISFNDIIQFWFDDLAPSQWWATDPELDQQITKRFSDLHAQAIAGELSARRSTAEGRLAEIIVLDQFSRNIYRNDARAFANDEQALQLSRAAIEAGDDQKLEPTQRAFLFLPFMHSESAKVHEQAVKLYDQPGLENNLEFEHKHKVIIDRFGRYPHRNEVLGRQSTPEELEFLKQPGSSF